MLKVVPLSTVIPYYERWIKTFPAIQDVAMADEQKILKMWQGLGYYQRAKNFHKAAQIIKNKHHGKIPNRYEDLKTLPGFGPYTIGAILSIAFDKRYPIIDANIRRVGMRLLGIQGNADTSQDKVIFGFLDQCMPKRNLRVFNQALMELGALVCRSKEPLCSVCPVKNVCRAFHEGHQEIIPTPKIKTITTLDVVIGIIQRDEKYFIQKRSSKGLLADLWEFPGGEIKKGETKKQAIFRKFKEELNIELISNQYLMSLKHFYTRYKINLHVFLCCPKVYPTEQKYRKWVSLQHFSRYPMPSGSARIVDHLMASRRATLLKIV